MVNGDCIMMNKILSALIFVPRTLTLLALRLILAAVGIVILPFVIAYCQHKGLKKFPSLFYLWDNDEDGYTGNQRWHWWDVYLDGKKAPHDERDWYGRKDLSFLERFWRSYRWSALRNPVNNMQRAKYLSWEVENPEYVKVKYLDDSKESYLIFMIPKGGKLYHMHFKVMIGKFIFRGGLKLKDFWYTTENPDIDPFRKTTTYTLSFFS